MTDRVLHAQLAVYRRTGDSSDCPHGTGSSTYPAEGLEPSEFRCHECGTVMPDLIPE